MEAWELMVAVNDAGNKRSTNKRIEELDSDERMEPHQMILEGNNTEILLLLSKSGRFEENCVEKAVLLNQCRVHLYSLFLGTR